MSRHNGLPGYDAWKTRSDMDDPSSRQAQASYCDLCDEPKGNATQYWMYGLETWVCEKCRDAGEMDGEDEDDG